MGGVAFEGTIFFFAGFIWGQGRCFACFMRCVFANFSSCELIFCSVHGRILDFQKTDMGSWLSVFEMHAAVYLLIRLISRLFMH